MNRQLTFQGRDIGDAVDIDFDIPVEVDADTGLATASLSGAFVGQYATVDRPSAAAHSGKILWDVTLGAFFKSDGADWTEVALGGGVTQSYLGKNAVGASAESMTSKRNYMKKITLATAGVLGTVEAYVGLNVSDQVRSLFFALWADNAGSPRELLQISGDPGVAATILLDNVSGEGGINRRWVGGGFSRWLAAGDYWIGVGCNDPVPNMDLAYDDGSGSDRYFDSTGFWTADAGFYSVTTGTRDYSIRASILR